MRQIFCQEGYEFDLYGEGEIKSDSGEEDIGEFDVDKDWGRFMGLLFLFLFEEKVEVEVKKIEKVVNGKYFKLVSLSKELVKSLNIINKILISRVVIFKFLTEKKGGLNITRIEKLNIFRIEIFFFIIFKFRSVSVIVGEFKIKLVFKRFVIVIGFIRVFLLVIKMLFMFVLYVYYMDLVYIFNYGNFVICDVEFFKRVRVKYYVYSFMNFNI